jgi:hypothetical protein
MPVEGAALLRAVSPQPLAKSVAFPFRQEIEHARAVA